MRRVCAGEEVAERSVSHLSGNGYYFVRILPYRAPNNQIDGVLLTFVDVTSLVAAEAQQKVLARAQPSRQEYACRRLIDRGTDPNRR